MKSRIMHLSLKIRRGFEMARHVPPRQALRRLELRARLHLAPRRKAPVAAPPALAPYLPLPLFPPRQDLVARGAGGLKLRLPWGELPLGPPTVWLPTAEAGAAARADFNNLHFMEFLESLEDDAFTAFIDDWIAGNPLIGPTAISFAWRPYNLSLRIVVWMAEIARRRDRLEAAFIAGAAASLAFQLRFLERHLETDLRGNHLIKNLKALLWGGCFFAGSEARSWQRRACRLLARELDEQVLADGGHCERSPAYHCQVMGDLLECHALLEAAGEEAAALQAGLAARLRAMTATLDHLCHPDGGIALFNDGGLSMAPAPTLLRALAEDRLDHLPPYEEGAFALPETGYFGFKRGGEYVIVDCGPLGPDYLVGHGHGDLLAFEWSCDGRRIIVDQGTYQYLAGAARMRTRSTRAHNTVSIAGEDQADFFGAFRCGRRPHPRLHAFHPKADGFVLTGSHDGFRHLPGRPRHYRRIEMGEDQLKIEDRIETQDRTERKYEGEAGLLLHPACEIKMGERSARIRRDDVAVYIEASEPLRLETAQWYPDLYCTIPTRRLRLKVPAGAGGLTCVLRRLGVEEAPTDQGGGG